MKHTIAIETQVKKCKNYTKDRENLTVATKSAIVDSGHPVEGLQGPSAQHPLGMQPLKP